MTKIRKKIELEETVLDKALERVRYVYSIFDNVEVSFSGGKDSTAVLNICLMVARELNRLPLTIHFFDEEAIHPPTIEYCHRVAKSPEIDFKWYCLEFKHRNACSNSEPFWYTWDKDKEDLWTRPLPEGVEVIREHKHFEKGMTFQEFGEKFIDKENGTTAVLTGLRAEESLRRLRIMLMKKNDNYISRKGHISLVHPIYDWISDDVWRLVAEFDLDYNRTYDIFNKTKQHNRLLQQRVCPPFGEEPLRGLWIYKECFPEMWHKMINRVQGVATAVRYANTNLYGIGHLTKPEGLSYEEWLPVILSTYEGETREQMYAMINGHISRHYEKTDIPIEEDKYSLLSGLSWEWLCKVAIKGDFKGRTANSLTLKKQDIQEKLGITEREAVIRYGKKEYVLSYLEKNP